MMYYSCSVLKNYNNALGEGPTWDAECQRLYWVDGFGAKIFSMDWRTKNVRQYDAPGMVGCVAVVSESELFAALADGVYSVNLSTGDFTLIHNPEAGVENNRFNDGKVDISGRMVFGSMSLLANDGVSAAPPSGSLYSMDFRKFNGKLGEPFIENGGACQALRDNITNSNGIAWNADSSKMYHIDTPQGCVMEYSYDVDSGKIANGRECVRLPAGEGLPDGMTIDNDGMLWVAHWGGYQVSRWNPQTGMKIGLVNVPVKHVTCANFGGPNMDILFITSSNTGVDGLEWEKQPNAGAIFIADTGCAGRPTNRIAM